jgi:arylsulfatase A-like enzyme
MRMALSTILLLLSACGTPPPEHFPGANVVLIGIDTLRADHLGCYGYRRPTSPRLDGLARDSVVFTTAISQAPWTLPAFASIFTGLLPSSHRAGEGKQLNVSSLDPSHDTLATVLKRAGYRTGSFVSNGYVGKDVGMAAGFDDFGAKMLAIGAAEGAVEWLRAHGRERFFLFLHIVDPHQPYSPSPEHAAPFLDASYRGPVGTSFAGWANPSWNDADRRRVIDLYDGEVHFADSLVGRVVDTLAALGVTQKTIVVVTSDHGEELFEHGGIGHGHTLFDELLHVPLIVHLPEGRPRGQIAHQVRSMDLFPTLLDALGLPVPAGLDAVSLLPMMRGEPPNPETETALAEYVVVEPERKAIRQRDRKLILDPAAGSATLFDLSADPHEQQDIAAKSPERTAELRARLEHRLLTSVEGFHLLVRGGREAHRLTAALRTSGRFQNVGLYNPEADDRYTLSEDGRGLEVVLAVGARTHRPLFNQDVDDEDGVHFRIAEGAAVEVTLQLDGAPMPSSQVAVGASGEASAGPPPWRLDAGDARLVVPFPRLPAATDDGTLHVALLFVRRPPPPLATMDEKTRESLRALGYIE